MGKDDDALKYMFPRPSALESAYFFGARQQELSSFLHDVQSNEGIRPAHLSYFMNMADNFYSAANVHVDNTQSKISFENDTLSSESILSIQGMGLSIEEHRGKKLYAFNKFSSFAENTGFFLSARPFPVKWYLDHIDERMLKRSTGNFSGRDFSGFSEHNIVAMAMLQIIEDDFAKGPNIYHPFILPERNGILVGHTMHTGFGDFFNRIAFTATKDVTRMPIKPYVWNPEQYMVVRTFYGPEEMTPDMKALRIRLLEFYKPDKNNALSLQMPLFTETTGCTFFDDDARKDGYFDAMAGLENLMKGPLWHRAVRLPLHLRQNPMSPAPGI